VRPKEGSPELCLESLPAINNLVRHASRRHSAITNLLHHDEGIELDGGVLGAIVSAGANVSAGDGRRPAK
jgi:hypothetical protein